jgi:hypothetical protein
VKLPEDSLCTRPLTGMSLKRCFCVQEWLAPEGPSREELRRRQQEAAVRATAAATAVRDRKASMEAMRAALRGNMQLGMAPDAVDDADEDEVDVDWRPRYDSGLLSTKQMKTAEAIRSKEYKMQVPSALAP